LISPAPHPDHSQSAKQEPDGSARRRVINSLSFRQARAAVIIAFLLGVLFSAVQIYSDLNSEKQRVDSKFNQLLKTVEESTVQAAYGLDTVQAQNIVAGMFQYKSIYRAQITDSFGDQMAIALRSRIEGNLSGIASTLFGPSKQYVLPLRSPNSNENAGKLEIWVNTYVIAETFFTRSGLILLFGIIRSLFLAAILAVLFHYMLTRPLHVIASAIKRGETNIPKIPGHHADELGDVLNAHNTLTDRQALTEDALQESEERFHDFARSSADWFWEMDKDLKYTFLSDRFEEITGFPVSDRIGTQRWDYVHPSEAREKWDKHIADMEAHRPFKNFDYMSTATTSANLYLQINGVPVFDSDGQFTGYRGSATDITGRKTLEDQLRRSQRMEAMGQLTGGVAHDFNNLLNIMLGNTELLEIIIQDDAAKRRFDAIKAAVLRGSSLTSRLLAFSRQQALSPVSADIKSLIDSLHEMLQRTLGETINLKIASTPEIWRASVDPHQFENALINLAFNARDAMTSGGSLTIETSNITVDQSIKTGFADINPGDYVTVAVTDSGTGMTPDVIEQAFEPFFTTKEVGQGSGLGLSMVYGFAKQSEGHVSIYSEVGEGTTVKLYMPRSKDVEDIDTEIQTDHITIRGSERVLVVEDDLNLREVPVTILREAGYDVAEAANGEEAIKLLSDGNDFDLLFTDVVLPGGINGVEIAAKAIKLQPKIKVLYATGYAENAVIHNGKLDPGVNLLHKPYSRARLLEKLRGILDDVPT
jgi:PAS domain S-box-containing protein